MTDFVSPITDRRTDVTKFFFRPGTVLPVQDTPISGSFEGPELTTDKRNSARYGYAPVPLGGPFSNYGRSVGVILPTTYSLFWKDRLHVIRTSFDAGIVQTPKQNDVEIHNAYTYVQKGMLRGIFTVTDVSIFNDANISFISGNESTPYVLGLGETEPYTYQVDAEGSATINATIEWNVTGVDTLIHFISGVRTDLFLFMPQLPLRESFAWFTSVIPSTDGSEKRQALRSKPRHEMGLDYLYGDEVTNMGLEIILRNPSKITNAKGLPVWIDRTLLSVTANISDTIITVKSTDYRDFRVGGSQGLGLLYNPDTGATEVFSISAFTPTTITAVSGLINNWPIGTEVYPLRTAVIKVNPGQQLWNINARRVNLVFDLPQGPDNADESGFPTYLGRPVFNNPLTNDGIAYQRNWEWVISRTGGDTSLTNSITIRRFPSISSPFKMFWDTRAEYWAWRNWLHARRGRQKNFWLPTNRHDFTLQRDEVGITSIFRYEINGYEELFAAGTYVYIRVAYTDGSYDYREITAVQTVGVEYEELTVDSSFSQIINSTNVAVISFLIKCRLDSDTIEFSHETVESGAVVMPVVELGDE